ncbi:uracil nucleotide/cysteinyl leukotriene receptor [Engraulis encrasicolus]|uniref:uracil nucleotide/cysteinyl leukotriene receptor n=1 Tax=Engraulis encrasicolus TaxID=184585 RepID=UPI002FD2F62F
MNSTTERRFFYHSTGSRAENISLATYYVLILLFSVPANAMALWVFCCHPKRNNNSRVLLTHLAVADMCYVLLLPMRVVYHASDGHWILGEAACRLSGFLFYLNLYCSLYLMTCVAVDRLLAVAYPVRALAWRKPAYAKVACAVIWVTMTVGMAPVLLSKQTVEVQLQQQQQQQQRYSNNVSVVSLEDPQQQQQQQYNNNVTVCLQLYLVKTSPRALLSTAAAFSVPLLVLSVSYILILVKLGSVSRKQRQSPVHLKAKRMVALTLANFLVAFLPYHVHRFVYIARYGRPDVGDAEATALTDGNRLTSALTCINGVIDPLMYFFLTNTYQRTLLRMLGRPGNTAQPDPGQSSSRMEMSSAEIL